MELFNRLLSDKPLNWTVKLMAYLLLVVAVIYKRPEGVLIYCVTALLAIAILFFIIRLIMVISGKAATGFRAGGFMDAVSKNLLSLSAVGFVLLIGLIIKPHMKEVWVVYALAGFFALTFIISVVRTFKRGADQSGN